MKKKLLLFIPFLLITSCNQSSNTFNGYTVIEEENMMKIDFDTKEKIKFNNYYNFQNDISDLLQGYIFYTIYFQYRSYEYVRSYFDVELNYSDKEDYSCNSYIYIQFVMMHKDFFKDVPKEYQDKDGFFPYLSFKCYFYVFKKSEFLEDYDIKYIKPNGGLNKYDKLQIILKGENSTIGYIDLAYSSNSDFKRIELLKYYLDFNLTRHVD